MKTLKINQRLLLIFSAIPILFLSSCENSLIGCIQGNGRIATETRTIGDFERISSSGNFIVDVQLSNEPALSIEADENLLSYIRTSIQGNTLVLETRNNKCLRSREAIRIYVDATSIERLKLSGSGEIYCGDILNQVLDIDLSGSGTIETPDLDVNELDINLSGSGDIICENADVNFVNANISGSGKIVLEGNANTSDFDISGSGDIRAIDLISEKCYARITGSGQIFTTVLDELEVIISGSGNVYYSGNPEIEVSITGSGKLRKY
jgi:hypothetical protein